MCFWWNCVQMCTLKNRYMDKAFEWFSISPGPHHIDYVKSNGGNFRAIFRSFSFSYSKNITNQITDWIGFVNRSLVRICGETQKWISKMREKKRERKKAILWSTSGRLMLSSKQVYTSLWQSRKRLLLKKQWQSQSKSQSNTNSVRWKFIVIRSDSHLP